MDIQPMETIESLESEKASDKASARLNMLVAITVALLATFMGICKVKDDNIVQAMQQAQANKLDHWAFYQARNVREEVAKATLIQLRLSAASRPVDEKNGYQAAIDSYQQLSDEQRKKKDGLKAQADQDQKDYDASNYRDDQFDLSDALAAIAISLLAVTALTHQLWLFWLSLVPTGGAIVMGAAGLFGWALHPSTLISWLS